MKKTSRTRIFTLITYLFLIAVLQGQPAPGDGTDSFLSPDSLQTEPDSIRVEEEFAADDSQQVEYDQLKADLENLIKIQDRDDPLKLMPYLTYRENFHLNAPFDPQVIVSQNGFSVIPYRIKNLHLIQSYQVLYEPHYENDRFSFTSSDYSLPVTLTRSYLALGDNDMNHIGIRLSKGEVFGLKRLDVSGAYLGYEGQWLSVNDKSSAYSLSLNYNLGNYGLRFVHTSINQKIPGYNVLTTAENGFQLSVRNKIRDISTKVYTPFVDLGFRLEEAELDKERRESFQFLLEKKLSWQENELKLSGEQIAFDKISNSRTRLNLAGNIDFSRFRMQGNGYWTGQQDYLFNSDFIFRLWHNSGIKLHIEKKEYKTGDTRIFSVKNSLGMTWNSQGLLLDLSAGRLETEGHNDFLEFSCQGKFPLGRVTIGLNNYLIYLRDDPLFSPQFQAKNFLELGINLNHGNAIRLGAGQYYCSEYRYIPLNSETVYKTVTSVIDSYLAIQITDLFLIRLDAVNLTNTDKLFGIEPPGNFPERHFNISVNWTFIN